MLKQQQQQKKKKKNPHRHKNPVHFLHLELYISNEMFTQAKICYQVYDISALSDISTHNKQSQATFLHDYLLSA